MQYIFVSSGPEVQPQADPNAVVQLQGVEETDMRDYIAQNM